MPHCPFILLGERWINAALPMQIIALIIPLRMVSNLLATATLGMGRPDISFYITLVPFLTMPVAFYTGSFWGLLGVSLSWAIAYPWVFCLQLFLAIKVLDVRFFDIFTAMQIPIFAAILMYVGVYFLKTSSVIDIQTIPKMFILIFCGALVYLVVSFLFNRKVLIEIKNLATT